MKVITLAACAMALATSLSAAPVDLSNYFSSFVAIGDSLSDDGKLGGTPFENGPPSLEGRFSNGITAVENIAQDFGFAADLAIGGATARIQNENPLPPQFGTFAGQVATLGGIAADPFGRAALGDRPLFSVLIGNNDILQNIGFPDGATAPGNVLPGIGALAADAVEANIRAIKAIDTEFNDFVVFNLPDLTLTPLFTNPVFGTAPFAPLAAQEVAGFNTQISANIAALRADGINIIEFDLNAVFKELLGEAVANGININDPCSFDLSNQNPLATCAFSPGSPNDTDITLADAFFFIDPIHPNRVAQAAVADRFRDVVAASEVAPVPLPAGLPLLIAGLAGFGVLRIRRAA
ncbi:SGNH/GDSL hydrolase family protein [Tateyamaria armeniaca]|uniref:SGNH/GDSL hydrolase family protein n=1 Tax=Tateyamaria armeniaca TaxID=2518930 RepID=A0ABW8UUB9_9RHOB